MCVAQQLNVLKYIQNNMERLLAICLVVMLQLTSLSTYGQENFTEFLKLFPEVTWEQMDSIVQLPWNRYDFKNSVPINLANRNMWYDSGHRDIYNHCKIEMQVNDWNNLYDGPKMKNNKGEFFGMYNLGIFHNGDEKHPDLVSPICKLYLSKNVVMLVTLYKYYNDDYYYSYSLDAFTYRLSDEGLLSAMDDIYCFPFTTTSRHRNVFFNSDHTITVFRQVEYEDENDGHYIRYITRDKYSYDEDGFFVYQSSTSGDVKMAEIVDSDGYVNIRSQPNSSSRILMTLSSGNIVWVEEIENSNWLIVRKYDTPNGICRYRSGYIHKSRIKLGKEIENVHTNELDLYGGEYGFLKK